MIVQESNFMLISSNSNDAYWDQNLYPEWAAITTFRFFPDLKIGHSVEPHYHDGDEFWLFIEGRGEVWLDGQSHPVTRNTAVYTPMGVVHRFQMFRPSEMAALVTRLERQKRATHIYVDEEGPPEPTVPGFVAPGSDNFGAFPDRGSRCPLSELRVVTLQPEAGINEARLGANEYWLALSGTTLVEVGDEEFELSAGDVALLRSGVDRRLRAVDEARLALARE